jgi:hypothetical protein
MYPVTYEADFALQQDRAKTFFRLILAIPWYILAQIYAIGAFVVAFLAWFALLFTGRYPEGFYNFNAGFLGFLAHANAFTYLQTDQWPPFGFEDAPDYPVRTKVDPPLEKYNRWKVGFRLVVGIPVFFMLSLVPYISAAASFVAWFHIVFTGRTSGGVHNALTTGLAYTLKSTAYFLLMTEDYPPISDQAPAPNLEPGQLPTGTGTVQQRQET